MEIALSCWNKESGCTVTALATLFIVWAVGVVDDKRHSWITSKTDGAWHD